jgi:hypothetical protein
MAPSRICLALLVRYDALKLKRGITASTRDYRPPSMRQAVSLNATSGEESLHFKWGPHT